MDASETTAPGIARNSLDRAVAGNLPGLLAASATDGGVPYRAADFHPTRTRPDGAPTPTTPGPCRPAPTRVRLPGSARSRLLHHQTRSDHPFASGFVSTSGESRSIHAGSSSRSKFQTGPEHRTAWRGGSSDQPHPSRAYTSTRLANVSAFGQPSHSRTITANGWPCSRWTETAARISASTTRSGSVSRVVTSATTRWSRGGKDIGSDTSWTSNRADPAARSSSVSTNVDGSDSGGGSDAGGEQPSRLPTLTAKTIDIPTSNRPDGSVTALRLISRRTSAEVGIWRSVRHGSPCLCSGIPPTAPSCRGCARNHC